MTINKIGEIYHRPWGNYQTLYLKEHFQVKILAISPGGRLSLQKHFKRSEHWIVVTGQPTLTIHDATKTYHPNESVFIPQEAIHRIENLTAEICELVEVQVGHYLGEDDIVRIDDVYGRDVITDVLTV